MVYLKMETNKGIVTIPFKKIEDADKFTVAFDYMGQLIESLIKILNLPLFLYDVENVYLTNEKYNNGFDYSNCMPIKYRNDNFNFSSLRDAFVQYLKNDQNRILTTGVKYIKNAEMASYFELGYLNNYELDRVVRAYFAEGTGYKRRRDAYFLLKECGDDISIKIDTVDFPSADFDRGKDLTVYSREDDDYLSHLIELSKKDPDAFADAMEEIGKADLEELSSLLRNNRFGIVDGVSDDSVIIEQQKKLLESTTGMSVETLINEHTRLGRGRKRKI